MSDAIRAALDKTELLGYPIPDGMTALELLGETIVFNAIMGIKNPAYANLVLDRTEGKVPDPEPPGPDKPLEEMTDDELDAYKSRMETRRNRR